MRSSHDRPDHPYLVRYSDVDAGHSCRLSPPAGLWGPEAGHGPDRRVIGGGGHRGSALFAGNAGVATGALACCPAALRCAGAMPRVCGVAKVAQVHGLRATIGKVREGHSTAAK